MIPTFQQTTGIKANRFFSYSEDPDLRNPKTRAEWVQKRKRGIGGSDIAAIAGVNPWKSKVEVFLEKTGRLRVEENERMKWGTILEQPVAQEFAERNKVKVHRINAILQHPTIPFALVNLDRLIVKEPGEEMSADNEVREKLLKEGNGPLEVKTTGWAQAWADEEIPDYYYTQIQWELGVTGLTWGSFAVLVSGQTLLMPPIVEFSPRTFENLVAIGEEFWNKNIKTDTAPDPDSGTDLKAMQLLYPDVNEKTIQLPEELNDLIKKRMLLKSSIETAEEQKKFIDAQILDRMKDAKYGLCKDYKVTRVLREQPKFQQKAFKEKHPELFASFCRPSKSIYPLYSKPK